MGIIPGILIILAGLVIFIFYRGKGYDKNYKI